MTAGRHVNSLSQSWCTPHKYVNAIKRFWNGRIDLDPCSNEYSVVEAEVEYCLPEHDGLQDSWNYPTVKELMPRAITALGIVIFRKYRL